ncbi:MAG: DUF1553 domain-containing protein, partial [Coraliomargarita sp.]
YFICLLSFASAALLGAMPDRTLYESSELKLPATQLDELVAKAHAEYGLQMAPLCSDSVFVRRVYLDLTGTLPSASESRAFLQSTDHDKRAKLIDRLLTSENRALYQSLRWGDLLRIKSEFPVNLWPNAVQAYSQWVLEAQRSNMPYDAFARAMLTGSGSNFRNPPVNFYRAVQSKDASGIAAAVGQVFLCTQLREWPEQARARMESFFEDVAYKPTAEWKEEIVYRDPSVYAAADLTLPDGARVQVPAGGDKRLPFVDWLLDQENPWFAKAAVNREWAWLMGRGIVHEPDRMGPENPPVNAELLDYLAEELVRSGYDLRHVQRLILNSRTYQQSFIPLAGDPELAERYFACYRMRRMDAEVLADTLCILTGTKEEYMSMVPEPYTHIPSDQRTIALADGSIGSPFLELFGRPGRDTGLFGERDNEPSKKQCLHLMNSTHVQKKLDRALRVKSLFKGERKKQAQQLRNLYMTLLSRDPTEHEIVTAIAYANREGSQREQAGQDVLWALINSKEFLYNH